MDGKTLTKMIDEALEERGMSQGEFCAAIGISSAAMSAWRKGSMPKPDRIAQIEDYLGIKFADSDPREELREDLKVLLRSAKDLPPSSVYALVAQIEREKENAT